MILPTHRDSFSQPEIFITATPCCQNDDLKDKLTQVMFSTLLSL